MKARIEAVFISMDPQGRVAAECWADYKIKLEAWHARRPEFAEALQDWPAIREQLRSLVKPPKVAEHILKAISAPLNFADLIPTPAEAEVEFAFRNAPLIRRRLTVGDLFVFLNWDQETLWTQVNQNLQ